MSSSPEYPTTKNMDPNMLMPTVGGKSVKRGKNGKNGKNGRKGGVDLTPFLTSLLLLGSKVVLDKRRNSKNRRPRRYKKRVGGNTLETTTGQVLSKFENAPETTMQEEIMAPPSRGGNGSQMSDLVNSFLSGGKNKGKSNGKAKRPRHRGGNQEESQLDNFENTAENSVVETTKEGGGRKRKKHAKKPATKPKKPTKRPAKRSVKSRSSY